MKHKMFILLGVALISSSCLGPKPVVREVQVSKVDQPGGAEPVYQLTVTVENLGRGEGQAELKARLIDPKSSHTYQESEKVELKGHEVTSKTIQIHAPLGDYRPEVSVEYPQM